MIPRAWVVTILQAFVCLFLVVLPEAFAADDSVQLSDNFGGPHGTEFSDQASVAAGQTIGSITIRAGERVDGISLEVAGPTAATFSHGGTGGTANTLALAKEEYITSMEAHWGEKKGRTRIFYLSFGTSAGNTVSGGSQTESKNTVTAPKGFQLGGFFGLDGDEIDKLGAIWTPMSVKDSIVLSESFGGPHGDDFSDKNFVNSGQKVTQISIYAGERLDGISMEISSPKTLTFTHGGTGGDRKVLKLGEGEYVNSMEVHWGKKNDRTRIFYVNFLTSAGNSLSGGSMTDDKSTVTAPEGFQLAGFFGKSGKEIDTLGAVWAYIDLVTPAPTPVPAPTTIEDSPGTVAPEDIAGSLSEVKTKANKRPVQLSDSFGGPHGEQFSDQLACTSGMTISSVTIRAGERLDGLTVQVSAPKEMTFTHGGTGGTENTLTLEPGEYITTMEVHWGQKSGHTRIFYMNLGTSKGNSVSGGSETKEKGSVTAPRGYQLAGFFGRYGDEMDLIGAVWSSIAAVNETSSTVKVSSEDDIALSELFGGPHGNAFSDINDIKFGQTISSITLRSAKRVDAVTLKITAPIETVLNHGGRGGTEQTITLAADEYITSMEAHWDKKDKHTRVFYISFTTSAGQTIAGGTKTENSGTATAPDGFVLSGFYGRGGDEVDQIGAIWTRKTAKNVDLTDPSGLGNGTYGTTIRNWVGPTIGKSSDTACYRKSMDFDSNNICPLGYSKDGDDCAARCPLSYPIACGLECIPQNDDCVLAVLAKIGSVVAVALNAATGGVFGQILTAYKVAKWAVLCVRNLVEVIRGLVYYLRYRQTSAPVGATAEMLTIAYQADVVLYDLPIAICTCLNLPVPKNAQFADTVLVIVEGIVKQAITNGDEIISTGANTFEVIVDQLIETGKTDKGKDVAEDDYMLETANMGLVVLSTIDPTGIAYMASQFVQPICGPTAYVGEIDDGTLHDALGLTTVDEAFEGSYGSYTHAGDGVVHLIFESVDTKDVTVVVHSGGDGYTKVDVGAGDVTTWDATFPELEDKTLYLDRWRPGLFGLPGKGGGSLLMWIPRSSEGGHITMHVRINPS
ncbi:hypothetical protein JG688_00008781 [Phytophthora aleatoria]|uniref:Jacalin-type lectin domain-containing protein n=1 Tax=Phytophthora aleatoria TaxID=2496075 RepID=A0A8J5IXZ9_9STRA|nr:hypothetical protein JG688_00008781 [Phytophthora aleatoria]